jgi:D-sedoheptulose 7-phosphate isomerase
MEKLITGFINDSIKAKQGMLEAEQVAMLKGITEAIIKAYRGGKKILVCGNGGSAADAQHFTAELVSRFERERAALPALALTTNTSTLTAIGNDYGYDVTFRRQVEAFVQEGDVVIGISTSGNSVNVLLALEEAKKRKAFTVGLTRKQGGKLKGAADLCFCAPSDHTPRVQECHILAIHIICKLIEESLFGDK